MLSIPGIGRSSASNRPDEIRQDPENQENQADHHTHGEGQRESDDAQKHPQRPPTTWEAARPSLPLAPVLPVAAGLRSFLGTGLWCGRSDPVDLNDFDFDFCGLLRHVTAGIWQGCHRTQTEWSRTGISPGIGRMAAHSFRGLAGAWVLANVRPMSRRSRKRGHAGRSGWLGKTALALIVIGMVAAAGLYAMVRGYLHSDAFRRFLSDKVSAAAKVSGEFKPFRWEGLAVDTPAFEATGEGLIKELRVEGLHTEVGVGGLRRGVWEMMGSQVQRLELSLDARNHAGTSAPKIEAKVRPRRETGERQRGWLPTEVELKGLDVRELVVRAVLKQGPASVTGMKIHVEPTGGKQAYRAEIGDGDIVLPFDLVPTIRLDRARLRYQDGRVFLTSANAAVWQDGRVEASGEWDSGAGVYSVEGNASGVKCDELFNETWAKRFIGEADTDFTLGNQDGALVARGRLTVSNGTLTALPVLDALAAYADTRRFRVLALTEAHTDWRYQDGEILLSDLVLASEGLVRLEGSIFIRGETLDGSFRLGLAPGTLAKIPGAETEVFSPGGRGLTWTPLRITGTLEDPKEDLTDRLVAAAGLRMFDIIPETGEKVVKYSRSLLGKSPAKVIDRGVEVIQENRDLIQEAAGVLDGLFGGGKRNRPDKPKEDR